MGYDLHITRALDWSANGAQPIGADEWLAVAGADPELVADPAQGPYAMRCQHGGWLDWFEGNVFTTDPDRNTVAKMLTLAKALGGIVQGDDGECYDVALQWPRHPPAEQPGDEASGRTAARTRRPPS